MRLRWRLRGVLRGASPLLQEPPPQKKKTNTFLVRKVTHAQKRNAWADRDELLHRCRGPRRNHLCRFVLRSLTGFGRGGGSNFGFLHWLASSPLQNYRTTVRVCDHSSLTCVWTAFFTFINFHRRTFLHKRSYGNWGPVFPPPNQLWSSIKWSPIISMPMTVKV